VPSALVAQNWSLIDLRILGYPQNIISGCYSTIPLYITKAWTKSIYSYVEVYKTITSWWQIMTWATNHLGHFTSPSKYNLKKYHPSILRMHPLHTLPSQLKSSHPNRKEDKEDKEVSPKPRLMTGSIWSICSPPGRVNLGMTPRSHPLRSSISALMSDWIWSARRSVMKIGSTWQNYTRTPWSLTKNMQKLWLPRLDYGEVTW